MVYFKCVLPKTKVIMILALVVIYPLWVPVGLFSFLLDVCWNKDMNIFGTFNMVQNIHKSQQLIYS